METDMEDIDAKVNNFLMRCSTIRSIRPDITMALVEAFLRVAVGHLKDDPLNGSDLRKAMGVTVSQGYRLVWNLGSDEVRDRGSTHPMGLVTTTPDPSNRNSKLLVLTPKGEAFLKALMVNM